MVKKRLDFLLVFTCSLFVSITVCLTQKNASDTSICSLQGNLITLTVVSWQSMAVRGNRLESLQYQRSFSTFTSLKQKGKNLHTVTFT